MNPFLVQGCDTPKTPLDPTVHGSMEDYVDVDRAEESFGRFQADFGNGARVLREGRLVVALGATGCGKTALINRCVRWLESANEPSWFQHVFRKRPYSDKDQSVAARRRATGQQLVDKLRSVGVVRPDTPIHDAKDDADRIYPLLDEALPPNTFVTLVLPPSDELIDELLYYAQMIGPKMLVFTETSATHALENKLGEFPSEALFLDVGPLRKADGDTFVAQRFKPVVDAGTWPLGGTPPPIEPDLLPGLIAARAMSIGELQIMLHGIYDEILSKGPPQPAQVTNKELLLYYHLRRGNERGGW
ncbi:hypothetical protein [Rugosimonospora africana]|uniref:Uncharacterized protein n=1 Tax=Rugosimonospora africana TaxID=556532 RepID=A0A8J3QSD6_9ACTN|nr:hypothetical protein [Rugosimonospora africana]GIH15082.1 hypothetical protein Raf01_32540 [Rugosimonospora africana]